MNDERLTMNLCGFARLNVAGRQANCDDSQVKSCVAAVKDDVSFNEDKNRYSR